MILRNQPKEKEMGTDLDLINEFDVNVGDDNASLIAMLGQDGLAESKSDALSSLRINYDADTENGETLKRGTWKMYNGSEMVYAESAFIVPMMRTYEYSVFDTEENTFSCKSVQRKKMSDAFPDKLGTMKCGRLTRAEEEGLSDDDPQLLLSKSVTCNVILYGKVDMPDAKNAQGKKTPVKDLPFISYFKRSGFRPINDFINQKLGNKIPLPTAYIELKTKRMANGGVTYWIPQPELVKEIPFTLEAKELLQSFHDGVSASNQKVLQEHRDSLKLVATDGDVDLAQRFG